MKIITMIDDESNSQLLLVEGSACFQMIFRFQFNLKKLIKIVAV